MKNENLVQNIIDMENNSDISYSTWYQNLKKEYNRLTNRDLEDLIGYPTSETLAKWYADGVDINLAIELIFEEIQF